MCLDVRDGLHTQITRNKHPIQQTHIELAHLNPQYLMSDSSLGEKFHPARNRKIQCQSYSSVYICNYFFQHCGKFSIPKPILPVTHFMVF